MNRFWISRSDSDAGEQVYQTYVDFWESNSRTSDEFDKATAVCILDKPWGNHEPICGMMTSATAYPELETHPK